MRSMLVLEEVGGAKALARFTELPFVLDGRDPRFAPLVLAWERHRLDSHRNPYFEHGDARCFLARRAGRPVGRVAAHLAGPGGEGRFGFWWVEDDPEAGAALLGAAQEWLSGEGCSAMTGPVSFTPAQEEGVLVSGFDLPGVTGRPWHPPHLARLLQEQGFEPAGERRTWRVPALDQGVELLAVPDAPGHAGPYGDPRLVLAGVAAVPDLSDVLRRPRLRAALAVARRARAGSWDTAVVVRGHDDPALALPAIRTAAHRAGYRWVVSPWPADAADHPETTHRTYRRAW